MAKRAVIMVSMQIIHELLLLPEAAEVLHVAADRHGLAMAVVITHPDLPETEPASEPPHLYVSHERTEDGRVRLATLGDLLPDATESRTR